LSLTLFPGMGNVTSSSWTAGLMPSILTLDFKQLIS
jgi:hypothetical protein